MPLRMHAHDRWTETTSARHLAARNKYAQLGKPSSRLSPRLFLEKVSDDNIQMGTIEFDTGFANVLVVYRAICFRPFVNEVLDAAVSHVTELGFFAEVGPLEVFVSRLVSPVESGSAKTTARVGGFGGESKWCRDRERSGRARCRLGKGPCSHAVSAEKSSPDCRPRRFEWVPQRLHIFWWCVLQTLCHVHPPHPPFCLGNTILFFPFLGVFHVAHPAPSYTLVPCFFVQGMPDDIAGGYDPVGDMWVSSEDSDTEIKSGCGVRLRIIGVTVGAELVRLKLEWSAT